MSQKCFHKLPLFVLSLHSLHLTKQVLPGPIKTQRQAPHLAEASSWLWPLWKVQSWMYWETCWVLLMGSYQYREMSQWLYGCPAPLGPQNVHFHCLTWFISPCSSHPSSLLPEGAHGVKGWGTQRSGRVLASSNLGTEVTDSDRATQGARHPSQQLLSTHSPLCFCKSCRGVFYLRYLITFANTRSCFAAISRESCISQGAGGILGCLAGLGGCWLGLEARKHHCWCSFDGKGSNHPLAFACLCNQPYF